MPNTVDRVTIHGSVYHQVTGQDATQISLAYTRNLSSGEHEQLWQRSSRVALPEWQPIEFGWITKCAMVIIRNEEGVEELRRKLPIDPSLTIEVSQGEGPGIMFPPAIALPFIPSDFRLLRVRCLGGRARYTVTIIPE